VAGAEGRSTTATRSPAWSWTALVDHLDHHRVLQDVHADLARAPGGEDERSSASIAASDG
jgi:hypothetical protein